MSYQEVAELAELYKTLDELNTRNEELTNQVFTLQLQHSECAEGAEEPSQSHLIAAKDQQIASLERHLATLTARMEEQNQVTDTTLQHYTTALQDVTRLQQQTDALKSKLSSVEAELAHRTHLLQSVEVEMDAITASVESRLASDFQAKLDTEEQWVAYRHCLITQRHTFRVRWRGACQRAEQAEMHREDVVASVHATLQKVQAREEGVYQQYSDITNVCKSHYVTNLSLSSHINQLQSEHALKEEELVTKVQRLQTELSNKTDALATLSVNFQQLQADLHQQAKLHESQLAALQKQLNLRAHALKESESQVLTIKENEGTEHRRMKAELRKKAVKHAHLEEEVLKFKTLYQQESLATQKVTANRDEVRAYWEQFHQLWPISNMSPRDHFHHIQRKMLEQRHEISRCRRVAVMYEEWYAFSQQQLTAELQCRTQQEQQLQLAMQSVEREQVLQQTLQNCLTSQSLQQLGNAHTLIRTEVEAECMGELIECVSKLLHDEQTHRRQSVARAREHMTGMEVCLAEVRGRAAEANQRVTELEEQLAQREARFTEQSQALVQLKTEHTQLFEAKARLTKQCQKLREGSDQSSIRLTELQQEVERARREGVVMRTKCGRLEKGLGLKTQQLQEALARCEVLKEQSDRFETRLTEQTQHLDTVATEHTQKEQRWHQQRDALKSHNEQLSVLLRHKDDVLDAQTHLLTTLQSTTAPAQEATSDHHSQWVETTKELTAQVGSLSDGLVAQLHDMETLYTLVSTPSAFSPSSICETSPGPHGSAGLLSPMAPIRFAESPSPRSSITPTKTPSVVESEDCLHICLSSFTRVLSQWKQSLQMHNATVHLLRREQTEKLSLAHKLDTLHQMSPVLDCSLSRGEGRSSPTPGIVNPSHPPQLGSPFAHSPTSSLCSPQVLLPASKQQMSSMNKSLPKRRPSYAKMHAKKAA
eukprot:NODE_146_length_2942_cov_32.192895_g136_i0.p1 GENE.NODE_146_length_2942_cov_32.192895_g136_i0~~NODE_146_length_2942_cov_32.192895_g136_i0.p1  ORF type:complete len:937 (-),score=210.69 NODE_146_length_2942_cov_32.192895_g136_i0:43-2853(-)